MNKIKNLLGVILIAFTLSACNNDGGDVGNNYPTYSESEQIGDLQKLNDTEDGLSSVGLKIDEDFDYDNGLSIRTYRWDSSFLNRISRQQP